MIRHLFPTTIFEANETFFLPMANELFDKIDWDKFRHTYNTGGLTTYYNKKEPLPQVNDFDMFKKFIESNVNLLAKEQGVDLYYYRASVVDIWCNSMNVGAKHNRHAHANSHYSGTYYINNPAGASRIKFYSPIQDLWGLAKPPIDDNNLNFISAENVEYDPIPGNLLVWNSWLYHEVLENKSITENRKTISFNIKMKEI